MDRIWYVYIHIRLDTNKLFYVGIGKKKNYGRAYEVELTKRNKIWCNIFQKTKIQIHVIHHSLTKFEASKIEMELIKHYGRLDLNNGILCNLTDGGDGIWNCKRTEETKLKLRLSKLGEKNPQFGKKQSKETILKRYNSSVGKKRSKETKRKQSLSSIKSGQAKKTLLIDYITKKELGVFHSISEACRYVNLCPKNDGGKASLVAKGIRQQVKGYSFKYLK